jgi:hypothetical protein
MLHNVAVVSANGDVPLADAVLECFDIVGDDGNVTLAEQPGPSEYRVEHIEGYPILRGYDECCEKFYPNFINDRANQRIYMEDPIFILYHGVINDLMTIAGIGEMVWSAWQSEAATANVVLVATGFSEQVLGHLAASFPSTRASTSSRSRSRSRPSRTARSSSWRTSPRSPGPPSSTR